VIRKTTNEGEGRKSAGKKKWERNQKKRDVIPPKGEKVSGNPKNQKKKNAL